MVKRLPPIFRSGLLFVSLVFAAVVGGSHDVRAAHNVVAGHIRAVQLNSDDTTNSVSLAVTTALNDFRLREGSNRGDFNVQIGSSATDDVGGGVLLCCVAENGRNNFGTNNFPIAAVNGDSAYRISAWVPTAPVAGSAAEYNVNVAGAWFPYSQFVGGLARNASGSNGGTNDLLVSSAGLVLGTHFQGVTAGQFVLNLTTRGIDSRRDGVLLVSGGKDENNYALSQVNTNDGTWNIFVRDNAQPTYANNEQDPVAFVFIPKTNTSLVSGRFNGNGSIAAFSGSSPQFQVTALGTGRWELKIPGHSPANGVLVISAEGGGTYNGDNIVSYQPTVAGDGWEIQSRDTPNNGLQTPVGASGEPEATASFVFIPGSLSAALISPGYNSQGLGAAPVLRVAVSNAAPGDFSVRFYGREAVNPLPGPDFAIVALPDTQYYTAERFGGTKEMFAAQTEWVVTNRISRNIAYVAHLGDISDSGDIKSGTSNITEWRNATNAMYLLENPLRTRLPYGVPYGLAVGNHDEEPNGDPEGTTFFYNMFFGVPHFNGRSYYAGHYGANNDNHFDLFSASGLDFVVLYFEYDTNANPAVLTWANEVLRTNAQRRAIAVTHYMGTAYTPSTLSKQGAAIYNALKTNANLFLLLGGHVSGEGSRQDTFSGKTVRTFISDYQSYTNGGNGFLRIMDFSPSNNVVSIQTFSPWTGEYETDDDSELYFSYNLQSLTANALPYQELAMTTVTQGNLASLVWRGLPRNKTFQWYVTVTDAGGNTVSCGPSQFTTGGNTPPVASNQTFTIKGDAPSTLEVRATDGELDGLTFQARSVPLHGLNSDFDTNTGTFTYLPARGYRGSDSFTFQANDGLSSSGLGTLSLIVQTPTDDDGNGLPDAWEIAYGLSDPYGDADGDGQNNLAEYCANTNPTNAASVLRLSNPGQPIPGQFQLTWSSVGGTRYRVQFLDEAATPGFAGPFTDLLRDISQEMDSSPFGTASTQTYINQNGNPTNGARYYRVKVVP